MKYTYISIRKLPYFVQTRTRSYAWSPSVTRDKDGSHTIPTAVSENPMLHTNFVTVCFMEPELWPMEVLHCPGMGIFDLFCSCDPAVTFTR